MREYWHGVGRRLREGAKEKGARVGAKKPSGRQRACLEIMKLENVKLRKGKNQNVRGLYNGTAR